MFERAILKTRGIVKIYVFSWNNETHGGVGVFVLWPVLTRYHILTAGLEDLRRWLGVWPSTPDLYPLLDSPRAAKLVVNWLHLEPVDLLLSLQSTTCDK